MSRIRRIYADTSIFGGLFEVEFEDDSRELLRRINAQVYELVISDLVETEAEAAPEHVREVVSRAMQDWQVVRPARASRALADAFLARGVLTAKSKDDAIHVALAIVAGCDTIVSWNFKHIVNDRRIPLFNAIGTEWGYNPIASHVADTGAEIWASRQRIKSNSRSSHANWNSYCATLNRFLALAASP